MEKMDSLDKISATIPIRTKGKMQNTMREKIPTGCITGAEHRQKLNKTKKSVCEENWPDTLYLELCIENK